MVIWFIGLSGAGKTTLATEVVRQARAKGTSAVLVDGDAVRALFEHDLGFSIEGRRKNAARISRFCHFLDSQGVNVVCAILSIFQESQDWNRTHLSSYFEVFIDAPLSVVEARDTKGLYAQARRGEITDVVGVDIPFPAPRSPDLVIRNDGSLSSLLRCAPQLAEMLSARRP